MASISLVRKTWFRWAVLSVAFAAATYSAPQLNADPPKFNSVLDWAPADAVYFESTLRLKEQWDNVTSSKAWAKFTALPWVQQSWMGIQTVMAFQPAFAQQENQDLMAMLGDLASHEVAFYCDQHTIDMLSLAMQISGGANQEMAAGGAAPEDSGNAIGRGVMKVLAANLDKLQSPTIVLAAKFTDAARVKASSTA